MKKPTKLGAIINAKCPRCREGDIFTHSTYNLAHYSKLYEHCECCDLRYEREPGFFFGAMYISYAFSVAIFIVFGFGTYFLLDDPSIWVYVSVITTVVLVLFPVSFRYSRVLMLHLFAGVGYRPELKKQKTAK